MRESTTGQGAEVAVAAGLAALAAGMGIGRFALTPLLPLLPEVTLSQGSALAAANYAGYLAGSVACAFLTTPPGRLARSGLVVVALSTLAMGVTASFGMWLAWRFVAGVASALVLIGTAAWALRRLAVAGRPQWAGAVFAGVGTGIAFAGALVLAIVAMRASADTGWLWLGAAAAVVAVLAWRPLSASQDAEPPSRNARPSTPTRGGSSPAIRPSASGTSCPRPTFPSSRSGGSTIRRRSASCGPCSVSPPRVDARRFAPSAQRESAPRVGGGPLRDGDRRRVVVVRRRVLPCCWSAPCASAARSWW